MNDYEEVCYGMDNQFGNWEFILDLLKVNVFDLCDGNVEVILDGED